MSRRAMWLMISCVVLSVPLLIALVWAIRIRQTPTAQEVCDHLQCLSRPGAPDVLGAYCVEAVETVNRQFDDNPVGRLRKATMMRCQLHIRESVEFLGCARHLDDGLIEQLLWPP